MKKSNLILEVPAYFSASIRGEKGSNASKKDIYRNIEIGKKVAAKISNYFGSMLNMYVPHNQDELIQILWYARKITVWDILDGDCKIVAEKELLIVYAPKSIVSIGMQREIKAAEEKGIPVVIFEKFNNKVAIIILTYIHQIMSRKFQAMVVGKAVKEIREIENEKKS